MEDEIVYCNLAHWSHVKQGSKGVVVHHSHMQGCRDAMEDSTNVLSGKHFTIAGVFDGHGGDQISKLAAKQLMSKIWSELEIWASSIKILPSSKKLFVNVKQKVITLFREFQNDLPSNIDVGTCVVLGIVGPIRNKKGERDIIVVNLGDSRGVLDSKLKSMPQSLTTDHCPNNPGEAARIRNTKLCYLKADRLNGVLAVTRALGDRFLEPGISCDPEFTIALAKPGDNLFLYCDGLYERDDDPLSDYEVVGNLKHSRQKGLSWTHCMRNIMWKTASHSGDNMSMVVMEIKNPNTEPVLSSNTLSLPPSAPLSFSHPTIQELLKNKAEIYYKNQMILKPGIPGYIKIKLLKPEPWVVMVPGYKPTFWNVIW